MKLFKNLFKLKTPAHTICSFHSEQTMPYLRPIGNIINSEYCNSCKISICYTCGNNHIDRRCNVECIIF
jgi:hypothetical protein